MVARSGVTWGKCLLRRYLNDKFLTDSFSADERTLILETAVKNDNYSYDSSIAEQKPEPLPDTMGKVFVLSGEEVQKYIPKERRILKVNGTGINWWIRETHFGNSSRSANVIDGNGVAKYGYASMDYGVRPAMWVKIK